MEESELFIKFGETCRRWNEGRAEPAVGRGGREVSGGVPFRGIG